MYLIHRGVEGIAKRLFHMSDNTETHAVKECQQAANDKKSKRKDMLRRKRLVEKREREGRKMVIPNSHFKSLTNSIVQDIVHERVFISKRAREALQEQTEMHLSKIFKRAKYLSDMEEMPTLCKRHWDTAILLENNGF